MSYLNIVLKGRLASFMVLRHNNLVVMSRSDCIVLD